MGGHGGLNILPQKKWNVYNYDNRAIVDKDKKIAAQKEKKKKQEQRQDLIQRKMNVMKEQMDQPNNQSKEKSNSLIVQQLKALEQKKKHINLFEMQQRILQTRDLIEIKRLRQTEFLKDKNMDFSSRFLGTYGQDKTKPWYIKSKQYKEKQFNDIKRHNRYSNGIQLQLKGFQQQERSRNKKNNSKWYSSSQDEQKEKIKQKKEKIQSKIIVNSQITQPSKLENKIDSKSNNQSKIQELRIQRLKREEKQRKKAQQLKKLRQKQVNP